MKNSKILDELIKGSVDEMVFGESVYHITKDGIKHIPFGSKEYEKLWEQATIVEETYTSIEDTIAKYKEYLTEEEITEIKQEYGQTSKEI